MSVDNHVYRRPLESSTACGRFKDEVGLRRRLTSSIASGSRRCWASTPRQPLLFHASSGRGDAPGRGGLMLHLRDPRLARRAARWHRSPERYATASGYAPRAHRREFAKSAECHLAAAAEPDL